MEYSFSFFFSSGRERFYGRFIRYFNLFLSSECDSVWKSRIEFRGFSELDV